MLSLELCNCAIDVETLEQIWNQPTFLHELASAPPRGFQLLLASEVNVLNVFLVLKIIKNLKAEG